MPALSPSSITLQNVVDAVKSFGDIEPVLAVGGYSAQPALTIANDVMEAMLGTSVPWKFNRIQVPLFYTNSYQQDYAIPGLTNLSWLENGICVDVNNSAIPKPWAWCEVERDQLQSTTSTLSNSFYHSPMFLINWLPNNQMYYGTWGDANTGNATLGNNPVAHSVYTQPLGANAQPSNPITQIQDANGNYLVLTTYGTEGIAAPLAAANSAAGTTVSGSGASTVWTVVSPFGQGLRIFPVPSQSGPVWQFRLVGQARATRFTSLAQTIAPITDDYESYFRQGFIAQCYRYSPEAKIRARFSQEWQMWLSSLNEARSKPDRERDEYGFIPDRGVYTSGGSNTTWVGSAWPFNGWPGSGFGY